jgi:hypothetical protein
VEGWSLLKSMTETMLDIVHDDNLDEKHPLSMYSSSS